MHLTQRILSDITIFTKYAKHNEVLGRRETWEELVERNKFMHKAKHPELADEIDHVYDNFVLTKKVLPSMRSMQFAGKPIEINNTRSFNCSYLPADALEFFPELMFLLLSGTGVGYSVQRAHVEKLPEIRKPTKTRRYLIGDSIEGWADSVKVLLSAYMKGKALPIFDFSDIRPKGARLVTSGGKAPGPEPLKDCLHNLQKVLDRKGDGEKLTSLEVHDMACYIADAVLAGGIRRAAMISLFDIDDEDMLTCKFGDWYELNPQRARSNNSAVIVRHKVTKDDFMSVWEKVKASGSGEPGFFMTNNTDWGANPCCEISLRPFQFCNLTEINVSNVESQEDLNARAKAAAFIGTLQAGYTNFHYLREVWKRTTEKDALIGVSMTGIASGAVLKLDLTEAANAVKEENARVAGLIGINKAARSTTVKPAGTTSMVLGCSSGIHAWHDKFYLRRMRVNKNESIYNYLAFNHPELVEDEFFAPNKTAVVSVPQKAPEGAITRDESALDLLARVKKVYNEWVKKGHRKGDNVNNVSVTVSIKDHEWDEVGEWMWENRDNYSGISVLPYADHTYKQAPFETITEEEYERLVKTLHDVDLSKVVEIDDATDLANELACAGPNGCEVI